MSGGTFDYDQFRIEDAINEIETRVNRNGKTVKQLWAERRGDENCSIGEYDSLWTSQKHPFMLVDCVAEEIAYKKLGLHNGDWSRMTDAEKKRWNSIRLEHVQKLINDHNESIPYENYSPETIEKIKSIIPTLKRAVIYLNRIDWLFAGDDGEESFKKRIDEDLKEAGLL